jgi:protein-S-isoprenylcysteine O-methyltransferase Ste14
MVVELARRVPVVESEHRKGAGPVGRMVMAIRGESLLEDLISLGFKMVWATVGLFWLWSARGVKRSSRTEPLLLQLVVYWAPLLMAFLLLGPSDWFQGSFLNERFIPKALWTKGVGLALAAAGAMLACWSRHILGRNWSSVVQLKQDHELIESGPYRYIRHPIYTGLLLAFLGTALKVGDWRGLLAVAIVLASFWRKLGVEERWLSEEFGAAYAAYRRRTKALVPGVI